MSVHYLFQTEAHLTKALGDPAVVAAVKKMFGDTVTGAHVLGMATLGLRYIYSKKEIHTVADFKGLKVRVQATPTEDAIFPAYGAQTVHMPFGSVYTSLQTGVIDAAENGINVYQANKHYEVAPIMSLTHARGQQLGYLGLGQGVEQPVRTSRRSGCRRRPTRSRPSSRRWRLALEHESQAKLIKLGIKFVTDVDLAGFIAIATPFQDSQAAALGPNAVKILALVRADK